MKKAEAQRGTVTWPKTHSEGGGSILEVPFPRIPSPSWLWVGAATEKSAGDLEGGSATAATIATQPL